MAVVPQQQISPARRFLDTQIERHPDIHGALCALGEVMGFFFNGHVVVWAARWIIRVSGYIAESALLFAVLWISATSVAPGLAELFMSKQLMQYLVWLALLTLALIPEIILANAIVNVVGRWYAVGHDRGNIGLWIWAALFTIPTIMFFALTAITLNTLGANGGNFVQASTTLVNWRLDAGWIYGLLELTYAGVKKFTVQQYVPVAQQAADSAQQRDDLAAIFSEKIQVLQEMETQLETRIAELNEYIWKLQSEQRGNAQGFPNSQEMESSSCDTEGELGNILGNTEEHAIVNIAEYRKEVECTQMFPKPPTKKFPSNGHGDAQQKALRVLKRFPNIGPAELAMRAKISRGYASKILRMTENKLANGNSNEGDDSLA